MGESCSYIETGECENRNCEVNLFLNKFINRLYKTDLRHIGFKCLDNTGTEGKRPEISFIYEGQNIVIEAKTLYGQAINTVSSFTKIIGGLIEDISCKNKETRKKLKKKKSELIGVKLTFDETILSLSRILNSKDDNSEKEDLISRILSAAYNEVTSMKKRNVEFGTVTLDVSKYSKHKFDKKLKEVKRNLYSRPEIGEMEDINIIESEWVQHPIRTEEYIRTNEKKLNFSIHFIDPSNGIELDCSVLGSTFLTQTKHLKETIKSAEDKFKNYGSDYKKILFFNNSFYRIMNGNINDGYEELIREIRNIVERSTIDEVWIEYTEAHIKVDHYDYIETVSNQRKGYERIYPYEV